MKTFFDYLDSTWAKLQYKLNRKTEHSNAMHAQMEGLPIQNKVDPCQLSVLHSFLTETDTQKALKTKSIGGSSPDSFSLRSRSMLEIKVVL